jgi:hypothetical protein
MPSLLITLASPEVARNSALVATLACVWLAAHFAQKVQKEHPRAFTALSLMALNWAVLLLYYLPGAPETEILSSISGFVLIVVGGLLYREAVQEDPNTGAPSITWLDTLPLFLFRSSVIGLGVYYLAQRLTRGEWGWGTLALALWGTVFSILGYFAIWIGVVYLYRRRSGCVRVAQWFGVLAALYAATEIVYAGWYVTRYWPAYGRYLELRSRPDAPDFQALLPFRPEADWPDAPKWSKLASASERGKSAPEIMGLRAQPRVPDPWVWLTYLLGALKLAFTAALVYLILRLPGPDPSCKSLPLHSWLDGRLRLGGRDDEGSGEG